MKKNRKSHGIHIISKNRPDLLINTITSIKDILPKIRSISVVINKANQLDYDNIDICRKIILDNFNNTGSLLNHLFNILRNQNIHRIMLFWEGEIIVGNIDSQGWSQSIGSFLKINSNITYYWQLRIFNLDYKWYFTDPYAEIPTLDLNTNQGLSVSKIPGEYVIFNLIDKVLETPLFFHNPHYIYKKACHLLLKGEIELASFYFKLRTDHKIGNEIISRSYLGLAICNKMKCNTWTLISENLTDAIKYDKLSSLEPIFFLLTWSLELEKEQAAYNIITDNHVDLYSISPPITGYLPYDASIYAYKILYLFSKCCFRLHKYTDVVKSSDILLIRDDLPIDVRQDLLHMNVYAKGSLKNSSEYYQQLKVTTDIESENIIIKIQKYRTIGYLNENQVAWFLKNNTENATNLHGFNFQELDTSSEDTSQFNFMMLNKDYHLGILSNVWSLTSDITSLIIPSTPLFCWNFNCQLDEILKIQKYNYRIGCLVISPEANTYIKSLIKDIKIPNDLVTKISVDLSKYHYLLYYGTNGLEDLFILLFAQLVGCHILYHGSYKIYQTVNSISKIKGIDNISGWSQKHITQAINSLTHQPNKREQFSNTSNYLAINTINRLLYELPLTNNCFQHTITILSGKIHPYLDNVKNLTSISAPNLELTYQPLIEVGFTNWSLIIPKYTLSIYQYLLANLIINKVKYSDNNSPDIIIIPTLNNQTLLANFKISVNSNIWELDAIDQLDYQLPFLIRHTDTLKTLQGCQTLSNLSRFINLRIVNVSD